MGKSMVPSLRFRNNNGEEFPSWEVSSLNEIGVFYTGLSGKKKEDFDHGTAKFIPYISVYNGIFLSDKSLKKVTVLHNEKQNTVKFGDILFTQSSETVEEVGMASVWISKTTPYLNSFCFGFHIKSQETVSPKFMGYLLRSPHVRRLITLQGQGISRFNLSTSRLGAIHFSIPSILEQQKIAAFFSTLDRRISLADRKLAALQTIKKGMLQKIFSRELRFKDDDGKEFPAWKECKLKNILTLLHGKDYKQLSNGQYPVIVKRYFFSCK